MLPALEPPPPRLSLLPSSSSVLSPQRFDSVLSPPHPHSHSPQLRHEPIETQSPEARYGHHRTTQHLGRLWLSLPPSTSSAAHPVSPLPIPSFRQLTHFTPHQTRRFPSTPHLRSPMSASDPQSMCSLLFLPSATHLLSLYNALPALAPRQQLAAPTACSIQLPCIVQYFSPYRVNHLPQHDASLLDSYPPPPLDVDCLTNKTRNVVFKTSFTSSPMGLVSLLARSHLLKNSLASKDPESKQLYTTAAVGTRPSNRECLALYVDAGPDIAGLDSSQGNSDCQGRHWIKSTDPKLMAISGNFEVQNCLPTVQLAALAPRVGRCARLGLSLPDFLNHIYPYADKVL
ncbi:hypothetical protein R3P38DRAFT_3218565 [Favolaschia claudopus]|uniref:Uncharacterized protein n=1 Tax=Favolaschia claudopus TaxID=2862362 RepID=A0AAW0A3L2_9AGAR